MDVKSGTDGSTSPIQPGASYEACHRVLDTVELLEMILLEADPRTALASQRVNKMFIATIKGSEKLQDKLWLKLDRKWESHPDMEINDMLFHGTPFLEMPVSPYSQVVNWCLCVTAKVETLTSRGEESWRAMPITRGGNKHLNLYVKLHGDDDNEGVKHMWGDTGPGTTAGMFFEALRCNGLGSGRSCEAQSAFAQWL